MRESRVLKVQVAFCAKVKGLGSGGKSLHES